MIILFGSYARGTWVEENSIKAGMEKRIRQKIDKTGKCYTPCHSIIDGLDYLNEELERGGCFFIDIRKEGIVLHNPNNIELSEAKELSAEKRQQEAQFYFDKWFHGGNSFWGYYLFGFGKKGYNYAAFQLHQSAENYFHAINLVFILYKPKTHDLEDLFRAGKRYMMQV